MDVITTEILELAAPQHGVVSRHQLVELVGVSPSTYTRSRAKGLVVEVVPGVVRFASSPEDFMMRCMAVQLRTGPVRIPQRMDGGSMAGLRGMHRQVIHVTVPIHVDLRCRAGSTCTGAGGTARPTESCEPTGSSSPRRCGCCGGSLQCATSIGSTEPPRMPGTSVSSRRAAAWSYLEDHRCRGKDGVAKLERWLEGATGRNRATQSNLERVLLEAAGTLRTPTPVRQHPLDIPSGETIHLDIAWPEVRFGCGTRRLMASRWRSRPASRPGPRSVNAPRSDG